MTTAQHLDAASLRDEGVQLSASGWHARRTSDYRKFKSAKHKLAQWDLSGPCPNCKTPIGTIALLPRCQLQKFRPPLCCECQGIPNPADIDPQFERSLFRSDEDHAAFVDCFTPNDALSGSAREKSKL